MDTESAGPAQQGTYVDLAADERLGLGPLEPAERQLLASLRTGEPAVVFGMGSDGADDRGRVRASLIRQVMLGRAVPYAEIDPHGLQLTGAHIVDRLDLDDVSSPLSLSFHDCTLSGGLSLARASTGSIWCTGKTRITAKPQTVPFNATSATITHHLVVQCEIRATGTPQAAVSSQGTRIGGQLDCENGTFTNPNGPALVADGLHTDDRAFLAARFEGSSKAGAVRLNGAHIGGQLDCRDGTFTNPNGPALHADGLHTDDRAFLAARFEGSRL